MMSNERQDLRYQLDGPMRKVREDLGLPPLESRPVVRHELPSAILEYPGNLTGEMVEAIRRDFERSHATPNNSHRPLVIDEGVRLSAELDLTIVAPEFDTVDGI